MNSVHGELFIPIFGEGNEAPFFHRLALSLSQRYDDYSDFGSTSNPKVGLNWQPVEGLNLRGTYGTSFRAPGLRELGATTGAYYFSAATGPFIYPTIVNQSVFFFGGNPNLEPEEATTHSFGVDLNPSWLPNLRASVTYYNIDYSNVIGSPSIISAFTDPTLASLVTTGNPATNPTINTLLYGIGASRSGGRQLRWGRRPPLSWICGTTIWARAILTGWILISIIDGTRTSALCSSTWPATISSTSIQG